MDPLKLIFRNLLYYWKKNLSLSLGIAISAAVITGSMIVGDSVKYSLEKIVDHRLGEIAYVLKSGDRFFSHSLSEKIADKTQNFVSAGLITDGQAIAGGGKLRVNHIQVLGVDRQFDDFIPYTDYFSGLREGEVIISDNIASRLNLQAGDEFLLRITKASLIPLNAPFVSDRENIISVRLKMHPLIRHPWLF